MVKMSQKSRDELIEMLRVERSVLRCAISKELHAEAKPIRAPFDKDIKHLNDTIKGHQESIIRIEGERTSALSESNLLQFDEYDRYSSCSTSDLHPRLKEFDAESNELKREIILM